MVTPTEDWRNSADYDYDWSTAAGGLAALLLMKKAQLKDARLAVVLPCHLYFDDAFTHEGSEAVGFGGWLSSFDRWIELEKEWQRALKEQGISVFHSNELALKDRGPYKDWPEERKNAFMTRLTTLVGNLVDYGVGCGIVRADYERELPAWLQRDFKDPLNFCVYGTMILISRQHELGKLTVAEKPLRTMIERKPGYEGAMSTIYYRCRDRLAPELIGDLSWGSKKDVPLQAADLIAYEIAKYVANLRYRPELRMRKSLEALARQSKLLITTPEEQELQKFRAFVETATGRAHD